ncbi:hypothetical protein [Acinetobacter bereziniae]|uniref:hypothetical protein n=1 Tax=Acinetobacter bereziniae TaxID=106648 RepID=UPI0015DAAFD3|nr:hypothetical protein [Acinetobacter bereziniae]
MVIDRLLQNKILQATASCYPSSVDDELDELFITNDASKIFANLEYLAQHKLLENNPCHESMDGIYSLGIVKITHRGLDFLADDGGLTAILDVVTVKFEADTLKAILENKINQSDLNPQDKQSMIDSLRELPADAIKHLTTKLLDEGLENLPSAILLIGTYLGLS